VSEIRLDLAVRRPERKGRFRATITRLLLAGVILLFAVVSLSSVVAAQTAPTSTAPTTTTSVAPGKVNNNPGLHLSGRGAAAFIAVVIAALALLWFFPIIQVTWSAARLRRSKLKLLENLIKEGKTTPDKFSADDIKTLLASVSDSSLDGQPGSSEQLSNLQGLTSALIAMLTLSLVGLALAVALLSSADDASDVRKTIITALLSILASIAGFYFGARTAQQSAQQSAAQQAKAVAPGAGSGPSFVTAEPPPTATRGQRYSYNFGATGTPTPLYTLSGPDWLTIDALTGEVSGTPREAAPTTYTVIASNSAGSASAGPFTVTVT
jgi:putative Ig domain-containing protein